jgi:hypothetical protein
MRQYNARKRARAAAEARWQAEKQQHYETPFKRIRCVSAWWHPVRE